MKRFRLIAAAFLFAALTISCNKEVDYAENAAGGYSFNFTIASSGFDDTKADATVGWTSGEKVYVFFKPANGSLLGGSNYVAFTYDGENWSPSSFIAPGALGEKGKMSAIYVPYFAGKVPATDDSSWRFDCGDVYYSCASAADYEVKNETVYGVLSMKIPDGYVQFVVDADAASDGDKLSCNFVDAYDHVTLNGDMNFSTQKVADGKMVGHEDNGKVYFWGKWNNCTDAQCKWTLTNSTGDVTMEVTADNVTKNSSFNLTSMPEVAMVQLWENGPYWSTVNLGASKPEEYGDYYAWGETATKDEYTWNNYKWGTESAPTKYITYESYGIPDYKTILDLEDDAAHTLWGDKWRIPTETDMEELIANTIQSVDELDGIKGMRYTGKNEFSNSSIFLPFTEGANTYSLYATSSLVKVNSCVSGLSVSEGGQQTVGFLDRYIGWSVRPIYADFIPVSTVSLNNDALSMEYGDQETLTVAIGPTNATEKRVFWMNSNSSVVSVSSGGVVTAVGIGTATITAISGGKTATCTVTVDYPCVDLGLSVKWATLNVGALAPEDEGWYFGWGETTTQNVYSWDFYGLCEGTSNTLKRYNNDPTYGTVDGKTVLESLDDVAAQEWGGDWRMPTKDEFEELLANTTPEWVTSPVLGWKFTSTKENYTTKSVFFPVTGAVSGTDLLLPNYGYYWSSTLAYDEIKAFDFNFSEGGIHVGFGDKRYVGKPIRPVKATATLNK